MGVSLIMLEGTHSSVSLRSTHQGPRYSTRRCIHPRPRLSTSHCRAAGRVLSYIVRTPTANGIHLWQDHRERKRSLPLAKNLARKRGQEQCGVSEKKRHAAVGASFFFALNSSFMYTTYLLVCTPPPVLISRFRKKKKTKVEEKTEATTR